VASTLHTLLIALLMLGAPAWCCGLPRALADSQPMSCHKQTAERDNNKPRDKTHHPGCHDTTPQTHAQQQQQNSDAPPACDCPTLADNALPAPHAPAVGAMFGDAPVFPNLAANLTADLARLTPTPPSPSRRAGAPPPTPPRTRLARICVLNL